MLGGVEDGAALFRMEARVMGEAVRTSGVIELQAAAMVGVRAGRRAQASRKGSEGERVGRLALRRVEHERAVSVGATTGRHGRPGRPCACTE